ILWSPGTEEEGTARQTLGSTRHAACMGSVAELNYGRLAPFNASRAARCVACQGVGSQPVLRSASTTIRRTSLPETQCLRLAAVRSNEGSRCSRLRDPLEQRSQVPPSAPG